MSFELWILCALALTAPVHAAPPPEPLWQALNGPPGTVTLLTWDTRQPDRLWAVAATQCTRGDDHAQWLARGTLRQAQALYRSTDGGDTWQPAGNSLPYGKITALTYDSFSAQLYAGLAGDGEELTPFQGLLRSGDGGTTWQKVDLAPAYRRLKVLAIGRSSDGAALYVGAVEAAASPRTLVYRSDDNGTTWQEFQALASGQPPDGILTDLVLDPQHARRLYLVTYGGLFISNDSGQSWQEATLPRCPVGQKTLIAVSRGKVLPSRLYLTCPETGEGFTATRLLRSDDGGATWRELPGDPLPGSAQALAWLPGDPAALLLATDRALYRSLDGGERWERLPGGLEVAGATALLARPAQPGSVFAATGHGLYLSPDAGEHWQPTGVGLPPNSKLRALLTSPFPPGTITVALQWAHAAFGQPLVSLLSSDDGGQSWRTLATGPWEDVRALTQHPKWASHLFVATSRGLVWSADSGTTWAEVSLDAHPVQALAFDPDDADTLYAGTYGGVYRSTDGGRTWMASGLEPLPVHDLAVTAGGDLYAATQSSGEKQGGLYRSSDGGQSWERLTTAARGLETTSVRRVLLDAANPEKVYIAPSGAGLYRSGDGGESWEASHAGLPAGSDILSLLQTADGTLWASRDGGGVYRSTDGGQRWQNVAAGLGENLVLALAESHGERSGLLAATDTAGLWALNPGEEAQPPPSPQAVDARIEIVWPHGGAPVQEATLANLGLRLFWPGSLVPPPCHWTPRVEVWQAVNTEPARLLKPAEPRSVEGRPFPFWELNDVDVSLARDGQSTLYFLVRVPGVETATSIWAHGADPRTYFPQQDTPTGIATAPPEAVEARIQIVWPHDGLGHEQPAERADWANVTVALFEPETGRSVPVDWEPAGLTLYGAWNQGTGKPLATKAEKRLVRRGAITFPVWDFNNVDVRAARNPWNKLYLWAEVEGVTTYPTIWAHGADARTYFPLEDEPIVGCGVNAPRPPLTSTVNGAMVYVGDTATLLAEALAATRPDVAPASSGSGLVSGEAADALRALLASPGRGLVFQRGTQEYLFIGEGAGPVAVAALGEWVYLLWPENGELWQQWWASGTGMWEALRRPPQAVRSAYGEKGLELGIAGDRLGSRRQAHYQLLRLCASQISSSGRIAGHWEPVWTWWDAPPGSWGGVDGQVQFTGRGLEQLRLTGAPPDDFVAAPRIFAEIGDYSKQRVGAVWERQGDSYVRVTAQLQQTPMSVLSQFIAALREGDLDAAAERVSDQALVEAALGLGWSLPRPEGDRLLATGGYLEAEGEPIEFFSEGDSAFHFRVHFRRDVTDWRISAIEPLPPRE
ncbi:MAG: YCF48-related protein [Anaerolineae bacterium]|nr:YCF48-related protein [Anaerolineae bacterium]